ncbi:ROK family glucokinase [Lentibacillus saliphilus]|uniref:ROK family glucokinase n=1 Tax=Lentibacillus saliphilus TaxID=2737028 RepID=UPI001C2F539D|nr:ROK family glucokinase [Lentibacillus saliphilus]
MTYVAGVDIGGTSVKIGIINREGDILHKWSIPTNTDQVETIIPDVWASIQTNMQMINLPIAKLAGIGVGAPGFIDSKNGLVHEAVNIGWKNYNLTDHLSQLSGVPVFLENDANIAALGENWKGAGNGALNVIAITLGTGVGGGIISNGMIISGQNGTAGEIGHMTVNPSGYLCNCGRKGCLETIVSATGIARQADAYQMAHPESLLAQRNRENGVLTAKDVFDLAQINDEGAQSIVDHTVDVLGFALANAAILLNPEKILIGGGVSKAGQPLIEGIKSAFQTYALPHVSDVCTIHLAQLGNDAGIIGGAFLVQENEA